MFMESFLAAVQHSVQNNEAIERVECDLNLHLASFAITMREDFPGLDRSTRGVILSDIQKSFAEVAAIYGFRLISDLRSSTRKFRWLYAPVVSNKQKMILK